MNIENDWEPDMSNEFDEPIIVSLVKNNDTMRVRVAELEAALRGAREALRLPEWPSKITRNDAIVEIDNVLKNSPDVFSRRSKS